MNRRFFGSDKLELAQTVRITKSSVYTVPSGMKYMDVFLVGGGGGGGSWNTWGYTTGMAGTGGNCNMFEMIKVTGGDTLNITVGAGGSKSKTRTALQKSATNGGDTILSYNSVSYTAKGGVGGINSESESNLTGDYIDKWHGFVKKRGTSQYQKYSNSKYYNGNVIPMTYEDNADELYPQRFVCGYPDGSYEEKTSSKGSLTDHPAIILGFAVPEFFDETSERKYAAPGVMREKRLFATSVNDSYTAEGSEEIIMYNCNIAGCGGYGGNWRSGAYYGGNGQPGICVIRFYK